MKGYLRQFFQSGAASGNLLILSTLLALVLANSSAQATYRTLVYCPIGITLAGWHWQRSLLWWVNDGFMALFFLLVGVEIKRELRIGALSTRQQALLPALAALGGMLLPALIYYGFNANDPIARAGWAIPAATDIAFSLGVLALLGNRVPPVLKIFLLALAIIDDLGTIIIISLFYSHPIAWLPFSLSLALLLGLILLNRYQITHLSLYLLLGAMLWNSLLHSGIHATLAGVAVGLTLPVKLAQVSVKSGPAHRLEQALHPWITHGVLPLFAFTNAGVTLQGVSGILSKLTLPLGVALGLLIGKPLGIFSFSWLAIKLRWAQLPAGVRFYELFAVSVLCGIGFTMSLYVTTLAFESRAPVYIDYARVAILLSSTLAAVIGYALLRRCRH